MFKRVIIGVIGGVLMLYTNTVSASSQQTVTLSVNVTGVVGLEVSPTSISFPAVTTGGSVTSNGSVSVKALPGNTANMKLSLNQINIPSGFSIGTSTAGSGTYVLCGVFALKQPEPGSFTAGIGTNEDTIMDYIRTADKTKFAASDHEKEDGYNIVPGDAESLWFRFIAPTSIIGLPTTFNIQVVITAESM